MNRLRKGWWTIVTFAALPAVAHADVSGSWRVAFTDTPGGTAQDYCRFDLVETASGEVEGHLGICGLGTDGVLSGRVDGSGGLSLRIVAPDDVGCEVYGITGTVASGVDTIDGTFSCEFPLPQSGYLTATRCDPSTPGSCPETSIASLPPRPHEIRSCAPTPAPCHGSAAARAQITLARDDAYHYAIKFKIPDAAGVGLPDLGDPTTVRDYVACVYHTVAGAPVLAAMEPAWAATTCRSKPCWELKPVGVAYRNPDAARGKLTRLKVDVHGAGAKTMMKGRVTTVLAPPTSSALGLPIIIQLLADDACLGATFSMATVNEPAILKAKNGQ